MLNFMPIVYLYILSHVMTLKMGSRSPFLTIRYFHCESGIRKFDVDKFFRSKFESIYSAAVVLKIDWTASFM